MNLFFKKLEAVHYNASLVVTDVIRGTSQERFNHELGPEPLSILSLSYLQEILSSHNDPYYQTRSKSVKNIYINLGKKPNAFANFYFPHYIKEWFKLSVDIRFIELAKKVIIFDFKKLFLTLSDPKKLFIKHMIYLVLNY